MRMEGKSCIEWFRPARIHSLTMAYSRLPRCLLRLVQSLLAIVIPITSLHLSLFLFSGFLYFPHFLFLLMPHQNLFYLSVHISPFPILHTCFMIDRIPGYPYSKDYLVNQNVIYQSENSSLYWDYKTIIF
jgi:hypothetical protein